MNWKELETKLKKASTPEEKNLLYKNFYINDIEVLKWIGNNGIQTIKFNDRIEYRREGKLHNIKDAAIQYKNGDKKYYINNALYEFDEWKKITTNVNRYRLINGILTETI